MRFARVVTLRRRRTASAFVGIAALLLVGSRIHVPEPSPSAIAARAFVITDPGTLAPFTLDRVLAALGSGDSSATWLEAITPAAIDHAPRHQVVMPLAAFIATNNPGYWRLTGTPEWAHLRPVAIVNRFDLAPRDYSHCGEYRLIFSRHTTGRSRRNIAIEVSLPNPRPHEGKAGCAAVAGFWWEMARSACDKDRRERLEKLFFGGHPALPSILDRKTFGMRGRIRTSEVGEGRPTFAQFDLKSECAPAQPCVPRLTRVPLDNMPDAALFDGDAAGERAVAFRREFLRQVGSLSIPDLNRRHSSRISKTSCPRT